MDYLRPRPEHHHTLVISDPQPPRPAGGPLSSLARLATVGIFLLLLGAFLYFGRTILLPIVSAAVIALTLAPVVKAGKRLGISPWITALLIVVCVLGVLSLAVTAMAVPISEWIGRAPRDTPSPISPTRRR